MIPPLIDINSEKQVYLCDFSLFATGRMLGFYLIKEDGSSEYNEAQAYILMGAFIIGQIQSLNKQDFDQEVLDLLALYSKNQALVYHNLSQTAAILKEHTPQKGLYSKRQIALVNAGANLQITCKRDCGSYFYDIAKKFKW